MDTDTALVDPEQFNPIWDSLTSITAQEVQGMVVDPDTSVTRETYPTGWRKFHDADSALQALDPRLVLHADLHTTPGTLTISVAVRASDPDAVDALLRANDGQFPALDDPRFATDLAAIREDVHQVTRGCAPVLTTFLSAAPNPLPDWLVVHTAS